MWTVFIALGSNLGDRMGHLARAVQSLHGRIGFSVESCSPVYESPALLLPDSQEDQPDFLNAVIKARTTLSPLTLLEVMHDIEAAAGRTRSDQRWQARTLDLDLLLFEDLSVQTDRLVLPHPGLPDRRFVLQPLADIAPEIFIPYPVNKSAGQALEDCSDRVELDLFESRVC